MTRRTEQQDCRAPDPRECGPHATQTWSIPASVLQVIWGDLFPRFVAFKWLTGQFPGPFDIGLISPTDLRTSIKSYMTSPRGGAAVQPHSPFQERVVLVTDYLTGQKLMPIRYLGEGGFDFILSDAGLDLVAPRQPKSATELLRYYEFRDPGRSTIGLAGYLDDSEALAFDVQSPTGPSQVWTRHLNIPVNASGTCMLENLQCLSRKRDKVHEDHFGFTLQAFTAAAAKVRCWQLEGSVYRGILEQLPRVVATVWRERLHAARYGCSVDPESYAARWRRPDEMREIFRERLETSLPRPDEMVFEVAAATLDAEAAGLEDVMITNRGITFPDIADPPPALDKMLTAISTGAAGNPVFTDSRRPPRGV